jgi:hypothetical protein
MKITIDLTKREIDEIIEEINFYFEQCESPAHSRWSLDSDDYSEKEKEDIKKSRAIMALLHLANQLEEVLKEE